MALLHALASLRSAFHVTLFVATLDHGIRGVAGEEDARFVEATAKEWGIACERGRIDVPALAVAQGLSLEQAARTARYEFFASVASGLGIQKIAVAHHADDQAETVLLHMVRGSGLNGLAGMRWISPLPSDPTLTLIRPFLNLRRSEIEAYAQEQELAAREDATNADTTFTRNRLRHDVLPLLRTINADVDGALTRLADNAASDEEFLEMTLSTASADLATFLDERVILKRADFVALHPALQRRLILRSVHHILMNSDDATIMVAHERVKAAIAVAHAGAVGAVVELGRGLQLRVDYDRLFLEFDGEPAAEAAAAALVAAETDIPVVLPFSIDLQGWRLHVDVVKSSTVDRADGWTLLSVTPGASVRLRTRQVGDTIRVGLGEGRVGTQALSKWMINLKIPAALRDRIPLITVDDQIAAIIWREIVISADHKWQPESSQRETLRVQLLAPTSEVV
ncbi:MAG: tRNA lysidine(34) synthetase TilS [Chloroflexi bacterium]|nr:tRNA lysidine(34) synthetase TilS [Chloroflexota bacterium]